MSETATTPPPIVDPAASAAEESAAPAQAVEQDAVAAFLERLINRRPSVEELAHQGTEEHKKKSETLVALRQGANGDFFAQELHLGAVMESLDLSGIASTSEPVLMFNRSYRMAFCEGLRNNVHATIWKAGSRNITLAFLLDYAPWNGVFKPFYDASTGSIRMRQANTETRTVTGVTYNNHYTEQGSLNFRCLIDAKNFKLDKILLLLRLTAQEDSCESFDGTYYMYGVTKSGKVPTLCKLPFHNMFEDGRLCCRVTQGKQDISVFPYRLFDDLENSPGNFDLARSENFEVIGDVKMEKPEDGRVEFPYLHLSYAGSCNTVSAAIPPIWKYCRI
jgi:hypothetical protein